MRFAKQWLEKLHFRLLHKSLKQSKPLRLPVSYVNSSKIGILFNAGEQGSLKTVQQFEKALQQKNKSVKVLAYCLDKIQQENYPYPAFGKKEVSVVFRPKGDKVDQFIQTPFDILFNLHLEKNLMLRYISACSAAHLRVGPAIETPLYYDLMIEMKKGKDLNYFIAQAEKILQNVNTNQHAATV